MCLAVLMPCQTLVLAAAKNDVVAAFQQSASPQDLRSSSAWSGNPVPPTESEPPAGLQHHQNRPRALVRVVDADQLLPAGSMTSTRARTGRSRPSVTSPWTTTFRSWLLGNTTS